MASSSRSSISSLFGAFRRDKAAPPSSSASSASSASSSSAAPASAPSAAAPAAAAATAVDGAQPPPVPPKTTTTTTTSPSMARAAAAAGLRGVSRTSTMSHALDMQRGGKPHPMLIGENPLASSSLVDLLSYACTRARASAPWVAAPHRARGSCSPGPPNSLLTARTRSDQPS